MKPFNPFWNIISRIVDVVYGKIHFFCPHYCFLFASPNVSLYVVGFGLQSVPHKSALVKTMPGGGSTSPTSTTSSSSGVSSANSSNLSSSLASSKSCDRIHAVGRRAAEPAGARRRDKSLDSHVKYRTDAKSAKGSLQSFQGISCPSPNTLGNWGHFIDMHVAKFYYSRMRFYHPRIYHPAAYIGHFRPEPNFYIIKPSGYIIQPSGYIGQFERCEREHSRA